jgi:hypothetical protein
MRQSGAVVMSGISITSLIQVKMKKIESLRAIQKPAKAYVKLTLLWVMRMMRQS